MAWRVIATEDSVWHVNPMAERRDNHATWQLTLSFRAVQGRADPKRFWAPFPVQSSSKGSVFQLAERIQDDELRELLAQFVS